MKFRYTNSFFKHLFSIKKSIQEIDSSKETSYGKKHCLDDLNDSNEVLHESDGFVSDEDEDFRPNKKSKKKSILNIGLDLKSHISHSFGEINATSSSLTADHVFPQGRHEHNFFDFLSPQTRKDKNGYFMNHPEFDHKTLKIPESFQRELTPAMAQWWQVKSMNMDTILFFKVGKFYELFHMDADVGFSELDLIYMKGSKAHSGFPEVYVCIHCDHVFYWLSFLDSIW